MSNMPSKAEIEKLAAEHLKAFSQFPMGGQVWFEGEVEFARAVLAKWGSPQPVVREPLTPATDLLKRCAEIYEWRSTGVLSGEALRDYAKRKWPDLHDTLQMAEHETVTEALALLAKWGQPAQAASRGEAPVPPPECETEAEKRAFAFEWFKALESERMKADSVQEDAARYRWLRRWKGQEHEPPFTVQHEIDGTLWGGDLDAAIDTARKQGANHD